MLGYFLTKILALWGLPKWQTVPDDAEPAIAKAIETYADIVRAQEPFDDVLGPLYMELASRGRSALGQFFTPSHISSMMAEITIGDVPPDDNGSLYRVCDPACGSGVTLLAFAQQALPAMGQGRVVAPVAYRVRSRPLLRAHAGRSGHCELQPSRTSARRGAGPVRQLPSPVARHGHSSSRFCRPLRSNHRPKRRNAWPRWHMRRNPIQNWFSSNCSLPNLLWSTHDHDQRNVPARLSKPPETTHPTATKF